MDTARSQPVGAVLILTDDIDGSRSFLTTVATVVFVAAVGLGLLRLLRLRFGR